LDRQKLNYYLHDDAGQRLLKLEICIQNGQGKLFKWHLHDDAGQRLLKWEIEKTKQKPKQPLKLFSGLILISFFRSHFNSSCFLSLLHYTPGQSA